MIASFYSYIFLKLFDILKALEIIGYVIMLCMWFIMVKWGVLQGSYNDTALFLKSKNMVSKAIDKIDCKT